MHARTLDGQVDRIINLFKSEILHPAEKWMQDLEPSERTNKTRELVDFTNMMIERLEAARNAKNKSGLRRSLSILRKITQEIQTQTCNYTIHEDYPFISANANAWLASPADSPDLLNATQWLRNFSKQLRSDRLIDEVQQSLLSDDEPFGAITAPAINTTTLRQTYFSADSLKITAADSGSSTEIVISSATVSALHDYIKTNNCMLDMTVGDFVLYLINVHPCNEVEEKLLANIIKVDKHPRFHDVETIILNNSPGQVTAERGYGYYKNSLKEKLLPALLHLNAKHPEGFVFTIADESCLPKYFINDYILALKSLITSSSDLTNLKGVICSNSYAADTLSLLPGAGNKKIPFITTNQNVELTASFNEQLAQKHDLPKLGQYAVVAARGEYTLIPGVKSVRIVNSSSAKDNLSHAQCDLINDSTCSLYHAAYALIHSPGFDYDEIKKARLCLIYEDMKKSTIHLESTFAQSIKPWFSDEVIAKYRMNYPYVHLSHQLLKELSTIKTKNKDEKQALVRHLTTMIQNPQQALPLKLYGYLDDMRGDLRHKERISIFGQHRLRGLLDKYCQHLQQQFKPTECQMDIQPARFLC